MTGSSYKLVRPVGVHSAYVGRRRLPESRRLPLRQPGLDAVVDLREILGTQPLTQ
jgi:hypothetical protein